MLDEACGYVGLDEAEFWSLTDRQYAWKLRAKIEADETLWDAARTIGIMAANPHLKQGMKPTDVVVLRRDHLARKRRLEQYEVNRPTPEMIEFWREKGLLETKKNDDRGK